MVVPHATAARRDHRPAQGRLTVQRFPDLRSLQSLVWELLSSPEGVAKGAAELRRAGVLESEDLSFLVPPDARLRPVEQPCNGRCSTPWGIFRPHNR